MAVPQTASHLFGDAYALGKQYTGSEIKDAFGRGVTDAALSAPLFAGLGEVGGRFGRSHESVDSLAEGIVNEAEQRPPPPPLGLPEPQKMLPAPEGVTYGDGFEARNPLPQRIPSPEELNARFDSLNDYTPQNFEPVEFAKPKTHEDLATLNTRDFSRPSGIEVQESSARSPEEQAMAEAMLRDSSASVEATNRASREYVISPETQQPQSTSVVKPVIGKLTNPKLSPEEAAAARVYRSKREDTLLDPSDEFKLHAQQFGSVIPDSTVSRYRQSSTGSADTAGLSRQATERHPRRGVSKVSSSGAQRLHSRSRAAK
jgi:hypothetical protein